MAGLLALGCGTQGGGSEDEAGETGGPAAEALCDGSQDLRLACVHGGGGLIISANPVGKETQNPAVDGNFVEIRLEDTGCGMDPGALEHAFEPFFTTKGSGTGLGLAIVKKIVDAHNGKIELESDVGRGTTVKVFLPVGQNSMLDA